LKRKLYQDGKEGDRWNRDSGTPSKMSGMNHINETEAHELESSRRIREETRQAVNEFRNEHPPHPSASSSDTVGSPAEAEEPPSGRFAKAGLIGAASGSGGAAKAHLGGKGWEGVEVPDKHGLMSPQLKNERKKVLKVSHARSINTERKS
jgi:hypothetical protein